MPRSIADGTRFVSRCPVREGWCPVSEDFKCARKPGLPDMHQIACSVAEVLRAGVDGTRVVLFWDNPEPLQYHLISIHSLPYPIGRNILDTPQPIFWR